MNLDQRIMDQGCTGGKIYQKGGRVKGNYF